MSDELVQFLRARYGEDEAVAREASGSTVVGEPGSWSPSPAGDEWEAFEGEVAEELLVALRPCLPRPPDVMAGYWGAWVSNEPDDCDPHAGSAMPALLHAARHDPARTLADIEAKRRTLARHEPHAMGQCTVCEAPHWGVQVCNHCERACPCPDVRDLARPFRTHPDFDPAWLEG